MLEPAHLQRYLRETAARRGVVVPVPPFTILIDPATTHPYLNYAVPDEGTTAWPAAAVAALRAAFEQRGRVPRLEYVEPAAPGLAEALLAGGFAVEADLDVMACTPATLTRPPLPPGAALETVTAGAARETVRALLTAQREAFGEGPASDADVERFIGAGAGAGALARVGGEPAAGGQYTAPADGLTEIVGIGTRERFRRRGLAAAVTAALTAHAFAHGARVAFLTPGDHGARRAYERVGFRASTRMLHVRAAA